MSKTSIKIEQGLFVTFEYSMSLETGERIGGSEPDKPFGFIVGRKHMLPVVEQRLLGMTAGEQATFWLMPGEAFGAHDPEYVRELPKSDFPPSVELTEGMLFHAPGTNSPHPFTISAVTEESVTVDMNHPLSAKKLKLEVKIHDVRPLTPEEAAEIASGGQGPGPSLPGPLIKA